MEVGESTKQDLKDYTATLRGIVLNNRSEKVDYVLITHPLFSELWDESETTARIVFTNPLMRWK